MWKRIRGRKRRQEFLSNSRRSFKHTGNIALAIENNLKALKLAEEVNDKQKETDACICLGEGYLLNNKYQKAIEFYEKALEIANKQGDKGQETDAYLGLGDVYRSTLECKTAFECYEKALKIARKQSNKRQKTDAYLGIGEAFRLNNECQTAIEYNKKALKCAKKHGYKGAETTAYLGLGLAHSLSDSQTALEFYEKALEIAEEQGYTEQKVIACLGLGDIFVVNNLLQPAIESYEKALKVAKKQGYKQEELDLCIVLGRAYSLNKQFQKATDYFKKALGIVQNGKDKKHGIELFLDLYKVYNVMEEDRTAMECWEGALKLCEGDEVEEPSRDILDAVDDNYNNLKSEYSRKLAAEQLLCLGEFYQSRNRNSEAIVRYKQVVQIANETNLNDINAKACQHLGNVYTTVSEYEKAIDYYQKAREISPSLEADEMEAVAHQSLGYGCYQDGRYKDSIGYYNKVAKLASTRQEKAREFNAYLMLGKSFEQLEQHEKAIESYEKLLNLSEDLKDKDMQAKAMQGLGSSFFNLGQYEEALMYVKLVDKLTDNRYEDETKKALNYQTQGMCYAYVGKFEEGLTYFKMVLQMISGRSDKALEGTVSEWCGYCCSFISGQQEEAIEFYSKARELATLIREEDQEYRTTTAIGDIFCNAGNYERAKEYYEQMLEIASKLGKRLLIGIAYLSLAAVCSKNGDYKIAVQWYEDGLHIFESLNDQEMQKQARSGLANTMFFLKITQQKSDWAQEDRKLDEGKHDVDDQESWKWKGTSNIHREKFKELLRYGKEHQNDVKEINGVRVCCSKDFLIGKGADGTRVYLGLGKDGIERAVKRLPKDACSSSAEQEMKVLTQTNATGSNNVVNYWFLDSESDKDYTFLLLDLCEETLESYVVRESVDKLSKNAPEIIKQVLRGLADLHCDPNPILHRDLKPSNILRDVHDRWLLADFGISRILRGDETTYESVQRGTRLWRAVETYPSKGRGDEGFYARYKKASDIQVAGMVAYYIVSKGQHPFGEERDVLSNLLDGKPAGLDKLKDETLKDFLSWMLSHQPKNRPSAEQALKHPYLQSTKLQFELLCTMGNQPEIKKGDMNSNVVKELNLDSTDWRTLMRADVLKYLCSDFANGKPRTFKYGPSWTECFRLIRNVNQHWKDRPRPKPQPEAFYLVGDPQEYFLKIFPNLPVVVHRIVRSCDWKERPELQKYFNHKPMIIDKTTEKPG